MKVTRALLLSSKKQAGAWESVGSKNPFSLEGRFRHTYGYLITDNGPDGLILEIYAVSQESYMDERKQECTRDKVADKPHVKKPFKDEEELLVFLHSRQIDIEENWQPVE